MEHMRMIIQIQAQIDSCLVDDGEDGLLLSSSLTGGEGAGGGEPDPRLVKQVIRLLRMRHRVLRVRLLLAYRARPSTFFVLRRVHELYTTMACTHVLLLLCTRASESIVLLLDASIRIPCQVLFVMAAWGYARGDYHAGLYHVCREKHLQREHAWRSYMYTCMHADEEKQNILCSGSKTCNFYVSFAYCFLLRMIRSRPLYCCIVGTLLLRCARVLVCLGIRVHVFWFVLESSNRTVFESFIVPRG